MPRVSIGVAVDSEIGLSKDWLHIFVPLFLSTTPPTQHPNTVIKFPIPKVIDMAFFEKFAIFIAKMLSEFGPFYFIKWNGLYKNIIRMNQEHIQHVTGFRDVIIERVVCSIHVVLGDWNGDMSLGHFTHETFFTDEHLTRTCNQKILLAQKTSQFSTPFLVYPHLVNGQPRGIPFRAVSFGGGHLL
jgi:hypothetical protein